MSNETKKTLRLYKCLRWGSIIELDDQGLEKPGCVAISHPVEVTFISLDSGDVVKAEIDQLEASIEEVTAKAAVAVQEIEYKIQSLKALPNLSE